MRVSGSEFCAKKIPVAGKAKQRMVADLLEVTVKGCTILLSVNRVFGGIDIDNEPPFVSAPKEGVGGSIENIFEGLQPLACCENLVLEPAECGLAGTAFMFFPQGQSECRVHPQVIGVITVFIACRDLINSLAQQLEHGMIRMSGSSRIVNLGLCAAEDVEALIHLPHYKKACIGGDLCVLKINADGTVKFGPDVPLYLSPTAHMKLFLPLTNLRRNIR
jgi:hypothetical protein